MDSLHTIDPKQFDPTIKPADDFFGYVNNKWLKANPIPADESQWGTFLILHHEVDDQLHNLLEEYAQKEDLEESGAIRKLRDFYRTAMDVKKLAARGSEPIAELLAAVIAIQTPDDVARVAGLLHRQGISVFWQPVVAQDEKQSEIMALYFYQGGLGLPDRDYYTKDDSKSKEIRAKYSQYIVKLLTRAGIEVDTKIAETILDIETRLAAASMTSVELRDVLRQYNKFAMKDFFAQTPNVNWELYFRKTKATAPEYVIVGQPKFFETVNRIFTEIPLHALKLYLTWHIVNSMSPFLTEGLERENFDFYAGTFSGKKEMKPRWQRVANVIDGMMGETIGKLYVERHFPETAKKKINKLVDHLIAAYRARIEKLDWMSPETKAKALEKLGSIKRKLGYPDVWKDYGNLEIGTNSYAENYMHAHVFEFDRDMAKIGKPVDRTEWFMSPQTINAYYHPVMNEIVFPAGILQPPFFDPNADDALNFGGIGGIIGHEITHGFDDEGSHFDAEGNLKDWWTEDDRKHFDAKTTHLAEQFDRFEVLPGLNINGKLTLGENIADLGGLLIAYDGLMLTLKEKSQGPIDGLTPEQRFFLNWAFVWRDERREELIRLRQQTDPHAPPWFRVLGPLSNIKEFYSAFDCKLGDSMWREPDDRVNVW